MHNYYQVNADSNVVFGERDIVSVNFGNKDGLCYPQVGFIIRLIIITKIDYYYCYYHYHYYHYQTNTNAIYDEGSKSFIISRDVCNDDDSKSASCAYSDNDNCIDDSDPITKKSKGILYPSQFGYVYDKTASKKFKILLGYPSSLITNTITNTLTLTITLTTNTNINTNDIIIVIIIITTIVISNPIITLHLTLLLSSS
jgi:hypothetical protein